MSKEKQIEEIRKDIFAAFGGYAKWEEDWQSLAEAVYNAGYRKQSEDVTDINVGNKSEWISVDERMPETTDKMLVYDSEGYVYVGTYMRGCWGGTWIKPVMGGGPITHWMPLPEPPKMKGGAEEW